MQEPLLLLCRYLYGHNYTMSILDVSRQPCNPSCQIQGCCSNTHGRTLVLQVCQQINRPTYRTSFLNDLTLRDDTYGVNGGSNEAWVQYLQNGERTVLHPRQSVPLVAFPGRPTLRVLWSAAARPNTTATWNRTMQQYNLSVLLYPGFALSVPPVDAGGDPMQRAKNARLCMPVHASSVQGSFAPARLASL